MSYFDFQTTPRYVQYKNALSEIKRYTFGMGKKFLIITACGPVTDHVVSTIKESFASTMESKCKPAIAEKNYRYARHMEEARRFDSQQAEVSCEFLNYEGREVTIDRLMALTALVKEKNFDVIVGIGGGKGMDFARGTAFFTGSRVVLVPTSAATNASASQMCVVYNEAGTRQEKMLYLPNYQDLVLADTSILINAPLKTFIAGIGDQYCTYYESLFVADMLNMRKELSDLTWEAVRASLGIMEKNGKAAVEAAKKKQITHEYESVLSQILHSCGPVRAMGCYGFPHLLNKALMTLEPCHKNIPHGSQVGYGIIPMKIYEEKPLEDMNSYIDFCLDVGIPVNFKQLGIEGITKEELDEACQKIYEGEGLGELPYHYDIEKDVFVRCLLSAEKFVSGYLANKEL
ncbi:MAG: iron-containing alcohol dehydrogenase [Christensenellales bacterium]